MIKEMVLYCIFLTSFTLWISRVHQVHSCSGSAKYAQKSATLALTFIVEPALIFGLWRI